MTSADDILTVPEVSALTRAPEGTLYFWRSCDPPQGPPSFKIGRRVAYRRGAVEQWLREQEAESDDSRRRSA